MYKFRLLTATAVCTIGTLFQAQAQLVSLPSGNVGIGTLAPSHQLHTTGSVRLQALTGTGNRLIQTDATGVLAPITGGTTGQVLTQGATGLVWATPAATSDWSLTGNTGNTAAHFLGTTDNNPIIVKTAGVERFRIRPQNNSTFLMSNAPNPIGTWDSSPNAAVTGVSMEVLRTPITYGANVGIFASTSTAANSVSVTGSAAGLLANAQSWYAGGQIVGASASASVSRIVQTYTTGLAPSAGGLFGLDLVNATISNATTADQLMGGVVTTLSGQIASSQNTIFAGLYAEDKINTNLTWASYMKGRAYVSGNLAVGTTAPTAQLHSVGTVRFQNLPTGTGKVLVADANGNVFVSNTTAQIAPNTAQLKQIEDQNEQINDLKTRLERLEKLLSNIPNAPSDATEKVVLEQNRPNPSHQFTTIAYELPNHYAKATLNITDVTGKILHNTLLIDSKGAVEVNTTNWNEGVYIYSLVADGKVLKSKKMVVSKN